MARSKRRTSVLSVLAVAAATVPPLPAAVGALSPVGVAWAAGSDEGASLQTLAQTVARGSDAITPERLRKLILAQRRDYTLVDLRAPDSFTAGHIRGAVNVPLAKVLDADQVVKLRRVPQVIVYADTPEQSAQAAVLLRVAGVPALALAGGLQAWAGELKDQAAHPDTAAIVRALNECPQLTPTEMAQPGASQTPVARPAESAAPAARKPKGGAPISLKGGCG